MKHIKQVFVFLSLSFLHRLQSLALRLAHPRRLSTWAKTNSWPLLISLDYPRPKEEENKSPKPNEWEIEIQGTGDGQGRATWLARAPVHLAWATRTADSSPLDCITYPYSPFFFSSIPWCFSPIEREKTRIYFHHSLRPVIHIRGATNQPITKRWKPSWKTGSSCICYTYISFPLGGTMILFWVRVERL